MSKSLYILLGVLRRDVMFLDSGDDQAALTEQASVACREGRASETFVVPALAHFTESSYNWDPEGTNTGASSVPPLNPGVAEQETVDESAALEPTSQRREREKVGAEQPSPVDTGHNPDLTPTGTARTEEELAAGKPQGAPAGQAPANPPAKTSSLDAAIEEAKAKK